tara:strand:+ start:538 stop:717 length:180 start_codon:yes stop_codon:yes gene_type:complete
MSSLIVSRRTSESVVLTMPDGTEVVITVNQLTGSAVKLHFEAPETVTIRRKTDNPIEVK